MAKRLKRAFTIVELVIVIAVIAILAAVLIPTFTTLIDKANESNDIALVKNLNTALVSKEATDEVNTMQDALEAAYEYGYTVDKLTPSSSGDIVWDEVNNRFALVKDGKVVFGDGDVSTGASLWRIAKDTKDFSATYSNYLAGEWTTVPEASTGVDVGTNEGLDVTYTNTDAGQTVTIRTNGGTLTVEGPYDTVNHYGTVVKVVVTAVANNSYHEYGEVLGNIELASGRVVVENNATVSTILVKTQSKESFKVEVSSNATVGTVAAIYDNVITDANTTVPSTTDKVTEAVTANSNFAGGIGTEKSPYLIATAEQFGNIGLLTTEMQTIKDYHFKLLSDIDARNLDTVYYFCGSIDGAGHSIILIPENPLLGFGVGNIVLKNIKLIQPASMGYLLHQTSNEKTTFENIIVSALDDSQKSEPPFYGSGSFCTNVGGYTEFINCVNELSYFAQTTGTQIYSGIFVGNYAIYENAYALVFENCVNKGTVTGGELGFFIGQENQTSFKIVESKEEIVSTDKSFVQVYVSNCRNEGTMIGTKICRPFSAHSDLNDVNEVNEYLKAHSEAFIYGVMIEDGIEGTLSLNDKMVTVSVPESEFSKVEYIEISYTVSTGYKDAQGNSVGSFYFTVAETVSASAIDTYETAYISKIITSRNYGESKYNALDVEEKEDIYGHKYKVIDGEDGYKTVIVSYKSLLEIYGDVAECSIGSSPSYSITLYDGQNIPIGSTAYAAGELVK